MKIWIKKTLLIALALIIVNIPLFFLVNQKHISKEQPSANLVFNEMIYLSKNKTQKQEKEIRENNLSGFSFVTFSGKFFNKAHLKMKIKDAENPAEIIREEKYEINPSYLYQLQYLTFDPIENSENKNFIIEISNDGNSTYSFANDENKKGEISLRPLYLNGKMINNVYYRISQYKPFFLKGPVLPITYWIFNLIFALFIFSHFSKSRK